MRFLILGESEAASRCSQNARRLRKVPGQWATKQVNALEVLACLADAETVNREVLAVDLCLSKTPSAPRDLDKTAHLSIISSDAVPVQPIPRRSQGLRILVGEGAPPQAKPGGGVFQRYKTAMGPLSKGDGWTPRDPGPAGLQGARPTSASLNAPLGFEITHSIPGFMPR